MAQKVISVNIHVSESLSISATADEKKLRVREVDALNKFLDEGWTIQQTIHSEKDGSWSNIVFILHREDGWNGTSII